MLTDSLIRKVKPPVDKKAPDRYNDGNGLYLHVFSSGGKRWIMDYRFEGKRKSYSIGTYPDVSLAQARLKRDEARKLLSEGVDPSKAKREQKDIADGKHTFRFIAEEWKARRDDQSESTRRSDKRVLQFAIDAFGDKPIDQITPAMVVAVCQKEEQRGNNEQAHRIKIKCAQVFRYAIITDRLQHNPAADLRGALKTYVPEHQPAVTDIKRLPALLEAMDNDTGTLATKCVLKLASLLFVRHGELRYARWADIDFETAEWRYTPPKTQNKTQVALIVPLARQAVEILKQLQPLTGKYEYVFHSHQAWKKGVISDGAATKALHRMGFKGEQVVHGFRAKCI